MSDWPLWQQSVKKNKKKKKEGKAKVKIDGLQFNIPKLWRKLNVGPSGSRQVLADMRKSIKLKIVHEILFFLVSNITVDHKGTRKSSILINFGKLSQKFYWEKKNQTKNMASLNTLRIVCEQVFILFSSPFVFLELRVSCSSGKIHISTWT